MVGVGVLLCHQASVHRHSRLSLIVLVAWINAGDDWKRVVMLGHGCGRHVEQNSIGVDEANLLSMARKGYWLALDHVDANLIWEQAHYSCMLYPGNRFELFASFVNGNEEDVAADVFAEDGEHLRATYFSEPGGLDVAGTGDAEARVTLEIVLEHHTSRGESTENDDCAECKEHAPHRAGGTPPVAARSTEASPVGARGGVAVGVLHFQRHAWQCAPGSGHTLLHAPDARLRGRFILPDQRPRCSVALIHHA